MELPMIAIAGGAKLVIVNMDPTGHDSLAAVTVHGKLGDFARSAMDSLGLMTRRFLEAGAVL